LGFESVEMYFAPGATTNPHDVALGHAYEHASHIIFPFKLGGAWQILLSPKIANRFGDIIEESFSLY
jgi:hypothetical protein